MLIAITSVCLRLIGLNSLYIIIIIIIIIAAVSIITFVFAELMALMCS